jgi:hypothetical protein
MNAIASRVEEARQRWNEGDLPGYLRLYDETIKLHGFAPEPMSKTDVSGFYQQIWSSFGDPPPLEFHEVMTDGDLYCCRFTMMGLHRGSFSGDRVVERWSSADFLGLMIQLGGVTPPES